MWRFFTSIVVTYAYICFSIHSSSLHSGPSTWNGMLPYRYYISHGFGGVLNARSLSIPDRSTSELLRTL